MATLNYVIVILRSLWDFLFLISSYQWTWRMVFESVRKVLDRARQVTWLHQRAMLHRLGRKAQHQGTAKEKYKIQLNSLHFWTIWNNFRTNIGRHLRQFLDDFFALKLFWFTTLHATTEPLLCSMIIKWICPFVSKCHFGLKCSLKNWNIINILKWSMLKIS